MLLHGSPKPVFSKLCCVMAGLLVTMSNSKVACLSARSMSSQVGVGAGPWDHGVPAQALNNILDMPVMVLGR